MPKLTHALINDVFRGQVYGRYDIFTRASFDDFVHRNDVDLDRALFALDGSNVIGTLCFAQRGDRAWLALTGLLPEYRNQGHGRRLFVQSLDALAASGVRAIEFENVQRNVAIQAMYRGHGFEPAAELATWARKKRRVPANGLVPRTHGLDAIERVAAIPAACWQREPLSVSRVARSALVTVEGAYAFLRINDEYAYVLDAGAHDVDSARALLREFDARVPYDVTLFNEPVHTALSKALRESDWRIVERQYRMLRLG